MQANGRKQCIVFLKKDPNQCKIIQITDCIQDMAAFLQVASEAFGNGFKAKTAYGKNGNEYMVEINDL